MVTRNLSKGIEKSLDLKTSLCSWKDQHTFNQEQYNPKFQENIHSAEGRGKAELAEKYDRRSSRRSSKSIKSSEEARFQHAIDSTRKTKLVNSFYHQISKGYQPSSSFSGEQTIEDNKQMPTLKGNYIRNLKDQCKRIDK